MNTSTAAYLEDELYHFSVDQAMDGLPVDVGDEVTSTQASFLGRAAILHMLPIHTKHSNQVDIHIRRAVCESL